VSRYCYEMMVVILTPVDGIIRWLPRGFSCSPFARDVRLNCYGRCVVTGVRSPWRTEAAHLTPRHEEGIPDVTNGILLRRDIHTLFDNDHCAINPDTMKIYFSREARELDDDLLKWHGNEIETTRMQVPVNIENLRIRWQKFKAKDRQRK
ncbi:HNH endonuclease signature motif containing protein, partial [Enterobacter hormaechei subsp. xiangfangensis]